MDKLSSSEVADAQEDNASSRSSQHNVPPELTHKLRFEQFRQTATLSVAAVGGVLVLLKAGLIVSSFKSGSVVAMFALSAALALFGQEKLIDGIEAGRGVTRAVQVFRLLAVVSLGAGAGLLIGIVL